MGRSFIFGPIEFNHLDVPEAFDGEQWRAIVEDSLVNSVYLPENLCIHGFHTTIKNKTLKRASTIVKHSRFLNNMIVYPQMPQVAALPQVV